MQFATANAKPKIAKEYVLPTHTSEQELKLRKTKQDVESQLTTMYKNNSGFIAKRGNLHISLIVSNESINIKRILQNNSYHLKVSNFYVREIRSEK